MQLHIIVMPVTRDSMYELRDDTQRAFAVLAGETSVPVDLVWLCPRCGRVRHWNVSDHCACASTNIRRGNVGILVELLARALCT